MAFATPADVYAFAIPAAAFKPTPKTIESVDAASGVLTLSSNGLATGSLLRFSIEGQAPTGATQCALPTTLSLSTMYTAAPYQGSGDLFRVAPVGGSVITSFASAGVPPYAIVVDQGSLILAGLDLWAGVVEDALIATTPPILVDPTTGKYHHKLVFANAYLFARASFSALGLANPQYAQAAADFTNGPIGKMVDGWMAEWKSGVPLNPTPPDQTPAVFENAAIGANDAAAAEWLTGML